MPPLPRLRRSGPSVPIPKSATLWPPVVSELRNRKDTIKFAIPTWLLDLKLLCEGAPNDRNFKSTTANPPHSGTMPIDDGPRRSRLVRSCRLRRRSSHAV
jgi:hypothetical protein